MIKTNQQKQLDSLLEDYITEKYWTTTVSKTSMKNQCKQFLDFIRSNYNITYSSEIKPSHLLSYNNHCARPYYFALYTGHFISYLIKNKLISNTFYYMTSRRKLSLIETSILINPKLIPAGKLSPNDIYNRIDDVKKLMAQLYYSESKIETIQTGIIIYCLYLIEFNLKVSLDSCYIWIKEFDKILNRNSHYGIGIFFATKLALNECVTIDDYMHHVSCVHRHLKPFPEWAQIWIDKYIINRELHGRKIQRGALMRFITFLDHNNITNFDMITIQLLTDFYIQDKHISANGKHVACLEIKKFRKWSDLDVT